MTLGDQFYTTTFKIKLLFRSKCFNITLMIKEAHIAQWYSTYFCIPIWPESMISSDQNEV